MKTWLAITVLALAGAAVFGHTPAAAEGTIYQWCVQPAARNADCHYATIEQCRAAASSVGFCYENPA